MQAIVPIIDKIMHEEGAFICYDKDGNVVCVTTKQEVANMYYSIPAILANQAEVIDVLKTRLKQVTEEYNKLIMELIPSGSNLLH